MGLIEAREVKIIKDDGVVTVPWGELPGEVRSILSLFCLRAKFYGKKVGTVDGNDVVEFVPSRVEAKVGIEKKRG